MSKDVAFDTKPLALDADLLATALDEIACGILILDAQGHLLHSNLAGQMHLNRATHLQGGTGGLLLCVESSDTAMLRQAISKALEGKRSMLTLGTTSQASLAVVPLNRDSGRRSHAGAYPRIALIFSRSGVCESLMISFFSRAHQLTRTEERVLSMLGFGQTAPEIANELAIGEATVRTHIRSICQKTQSHGIREVLKRLALLPPLMASVMPAAFV